jgi:RNA polymerase sigma-70 factor, ECF subfamily
MSTDQLTITRDLAERVHAGIPGAEAELCERYGRGLRFLLRRLGQSPEAAEDLAQETLVIVLERLRGRGLEDPAGLSAFIHGVARNLALSERRKFVRRRTETDSERLADTAAGPSDPFQEAAEQEEASQVRRLIGELPVARDRQLLWRFYVGEEDKSTICRDLELDGSHFNRVLFRARQRFKELLQGACGAKE